MLAVHIITIFTLLRDASMLLSVFSLLDWVIHSGFKSTVNLLNDKPKVEKRSKEVHEENKV